MIEIRGLSKTYGARHALCEVDLDLTDGEVVTLMGPNGAGKTTLLRIVAMLARPSTGAVILNGVDLARAGAEARRLVGFLSHRSMLYKDLTSEQNLRFYARLYRVTDASERIGSLLDTVGLLDRASDPVRAYSRGMQQRLMLARALLHRPRVLLLDEPYAGLDEDARAMCDGILVDAKHDGVMVLTATHEMAHSLTMADRVVVLSQGRVALDARTSAIDAGDFANDYHLLVS